MFFIVRSESTNVYDFLDSFILPPPSKRKKKSSKKKKKNDEDNKNGDDKKKKNDEHKKRKVPGPTQPETSKKMKSSVPPAPVPVHHSQTTGRV